MRARPLVLSLVLLAAPAAAPAAAENCAGGTVFLARHAEKFLTGNKEADKEAPLSAAGQARAAALAHALRDAGIDAVFTSDRRRTQETAAPLADLAGAEPAVRKQDATLGEEIRRDFCGKEVLVVGHSNTLNEVMAGLGVSAPPADLELDAFDRLYVVRWSTAAGAKSELLTLRFGAPTP